IGTVKKRAAPLPPPGGSHSRSPSDPNPSYQNTLNHHKRSPSTDSSRTSLVHHLAGAKLVIPPGEIPTLKSTGIDKTGGSMVQRPRGPPPPAPPASSRLSNGQSTESIASLTSDIEAAVSAANPQPYFYCPLEDKPVVVGSSGGGCRALYDCLADNEDELSFREGDIILVTSASTQDENWMEGALEKDPTVKGMFPISFVHMLPDN
ncbi:hypothetical protein AAG570_014113, partial [Ranatra chinensis]